MSFNENGVEHTVADTIAAKDKCNELILACDEFNKVISKYDISLTEVDNLKQRMLEDVDFLNGEIKRLG